MSYLDVPRLHFSGKFQAAPSTINNTPTNFSPDAVPPAPDWNPNGSHWFKLACTVRTVVPPEPSTGTDPLVGMPVASTDSPQVAKLVDLDPEQQMVSTVFGMVVRIGTDTDYVQGTFKPVNFVDIFGRVIGGQQDSMFAAAYQSVLEDLEWSSTLTSPLLQALQTASPDKLSIRFVVDAFQDVSQDPVTYMPFQTFTWGRVTGTVGPWQATEPTNFTLGRLLRPNPNGSLMNYAPFRVDTTRKVVLADFGNAMPTLSPAGSVPTQLGTLSLAYTSAGGDTVALGVIDYSDAAYENTAMVQEFAVPDDVLDLVDSTPLFVSQSGGAGLMLPPGRTGAPLVENPTGAYVDATQYVYRMEAGATAQAELVALQFGKPAAGQTIAVAADNGALIGQQGPGGPAVAVPAGALTYPSQVTTDANGHASFTLTSTDPGNPRVYIDGQVYGVGWQWSQDSYPDGGAFLSVLVFNAFTAPATPTWDADVKPIFDQYMRLYPFMQDRVDLGDYPTVVALRAQIAQYLMLPTTHPSHMPVTRDLSVAKRDFLVSWLNAIDPTGVPQSMAGIMYAGQTTPADTPMPGGSSGSAGSASTGSSESAGSSASAPAASSESAGPSASAPAASTGSSAAPEPGGAAASGGSNESAGSAGSAAPPPAAPTPPATA